MPPTRTSPALSPHRPPSLSSIPFKFRRKSLSEDDLPVFPSPSLSPSLSASMSSSPPSSPTVLSTSPTRPSHLDSARVHQSSSPVRPAAYHAYGYAYSYPRAGSHPFGYEHDSWSAEHPSKPVPTRSHAYAVIPPPLSSSSRSSYSPLSPTDPDASDPFYSSASDSGFPHDDHDDEIEDAFGFTLDMDGILNASSPSRRVSFTTSSERDRPFVRPPAQLPKHRAPARDKRATTKTDGSSTEIPHGSLGVSRGTGDSLQSESPLPQTRETPRRPTTPVRPRTHAPSASSHPSATTVVDDNDDLPPSSPLLSPLSSPLSSPTTDEDTTRARDASLPPSSPISIPRSPMCSLESREDTELAFVVTPSPPSPTLDALRITSRVAVRALLNPMPEPTITPETGVVEKVKQAELPVEQPSKIEADGDVTPFDLSAPAMADIPVAPQAMSVAVNVEVVEKVSQQSSVAPSRAQSCLPVVLSRASTPDSIMQDIPSSPLSSPPRSIAGDIDAIVDIADVGMDADVDIDIDIETEDAAPTISTLTPVTSVSARSSRAPSVAPAVRERSAERVDEPPRKKARHEDRAESSASPAPLPDSHPNTTRTEREQSECKSRPKSLHKKRRRVVWSDDETESEADVTDAPVPVLASLPKPAPAPVKASRRKEKDGVQERERKRVREKEHDKDPRERTKKPRARDAGGADVENEPLEPPSGAVPASKATTASKPAARSAAPPKSATNFERSNVTVPETTKHAETTLQKIVPESVPTLEAEPPSAVPEVKSKAAARQQDKRHTQHEDGPALPEYTLPLPAGELEGMLIETLATARASSLATSALYGALMAARPALREMALPVLAGSVPEEAGAEKEKESEKSKEGEKEKKPKGGRGRGAKAEADAASRRAWVPALEVVLEAGWRRSGVFGKVVNCGTDTGDQELALEARWFYDPDRDEDGERAALVRSMMRRPGKRSETKKAKQYYWRPLPKISRWDPEDEL